MANDAITVNPNGSNISITSHGSDWLWAVFAIMLATDIGFMVWSWTLPKGRRTFHHLAEFILTTAAIAYFTMASNLGSTPVLVEFTKAGNGTRAIWYARYIDWVITTPALLLELLLSTGLPLSDIMTCLFFDLVMIVTGLVGALVVSSYKWGYFAFGTAALFYIWYILLGPAMTSTAALGPEFKKSYLASAIYLSALWALYPVAWGLADGANIIGADGEMVFYGVLDVLAKPVFCLFHVWSIRNLDYNKLQLQSGKYSVGAHYTPAHDAEMNNMHKNRVADATAAHPRASEATAVAH